MPVLPVSGRSWLDLLRPERGVFNHVHDARALHGLEVVTWLDTKAFCSRPAFLSRNAANSPSPMSYNDNYRKLSSQVIVKSPQFRLS